MTEFLRYILAGVIALAAHICVMVVCVEGFGLSKPLASTLGLVASLPVNYGLQHFYVFRARGRLFGRFQIYLGLTLATACLNALLMTLATTRTAIPYPIAQIFVTGAIFLLNFAGNRALTFAWR